MWYILFILHWVTGCSEDNIKFLQTASFGLHKEEVDNRDEGGVEYRVDDVDLSADVGKRGRDCHHDHEVEDSVYSISNIVDLGLRTYGCDFGRVKEELTDPSEIEKGVKGE